jgi:hypothetical protein
MKSSVRGCRGGENNGNNDGGERGGGRLGGESIFLEVKHVATAVSSSTLGGEGRNAMIPIDTLCRNIWCHQCPAPALAPLPSELVRV